MTDHPEQHPLIDDEELETLDAFLDSDTVDEETLSIYGTHGFMVAQAIALNRMDAAVWVPTIFNGEPPFENDEEQSSILALCQALRDNAIELFEQGEYVELPFDDEFELDTRNHPVADWCSGFMESVFMDETAWFGDLEEEAAKLLLPFMALSGLFDDEDADLAAMGATPKDAQKLMAQLPELALDLYLLYRTPKETKKPAPSAKSGQTGKKKGARKR
ncbi:YecA family protein [Larsenimonas suaedae]|uniref:YecA family protein n=1 Tax=Larsenimonas suaedae TaxID=1851019 RepID=A0ABU1GTT1_9GAMM|nr:YecA family protein [Larsenimonas suaedae]MCM2971872.1 YecA family protein [Larsenimonas suaedae]MDR5895424.1 YecA family protein [Larsenimonas suaedae]